MRETILLSIKQNSIFIHIYFIETVLLNPGHLLLLEIPNQIEINDKLEVQSQQGISIGNLRLILQPLTENQNTLKI